MFVVALTLLYALGYYLLYPGLKLVSVGLNKQLEGASGKTLARFGFSYLAYLAYVVLVVIYMIHIHHPILILIFAVPLVFGWLLQIKEKIMN